MAKILVVDDQDENVYLLKILLGSNNYDIIEAYTGEEALEKVEEHQPNLILLDIMLPGIDGYEVCRRIRENPKHKFLPIIMLTAKRDIESKIEGLEYGANDYLTKPFNRQEVLARVKSLLTIQDLQKQLMKAERLVAIGEMVVTVNHEINNPLAAILGNAELLALKLGEADENITQKIQTIKDQALRIKNILKKIKELKEATPTTYLDDTTMIDVSEDQN